MPADFLSRGGGGAAIVNICCNGRSPAKRLALFIPLSCTTGELIRESVEDRASLKAGALSIGEEGLISFEDALKIVGEGPFFLASTNVILISPKVSFLPFSVVIPI